MQLAGREPTDDILGYKPFVDGLRAISIVAVVAYHAGVPGVESGFIGVDVFFVISGYLIISQIVAGLYAGTFSFAGFWARRVLRILPPYLLVVGACVLIAPLVLVTPAELEEFGREAQYSALMVVNYYFLASKGYFDISSELKPLLHLWSLAVEEQFYLVAPLILFGLWWFGRRFGRFRSATWALAIVGVATVSFAFCVARTSGGNSAFFLMPYRAWEFVLGGVIPLLVPGVRRRIPAFFVDLLAVVGAALIVGAALRLGEVPYPSYYALLPVAGACLVILTGLARPENPVARVLATGPFVWVGLISYAWYLWHWPLISFARIHNFGESIADWRWGAVALSLALAAATHHFLEVPIKRWRSTKRVRLGWHVTATGVAAAVCISLVGSAYVHLLAPAVERQLAAKGLGVDSDWTVLKDPCAIKPQNQELARCFGGGEERPFGVLVGNSHARMIYGTLNDKADQLGVELVGLVKVACIPYYPVASLEGIGLRQKCSDFYTKGANRIRELPGRPAFAIFSARWNNKESFDEVLKVAPAEVLAAAGLRLPPPADLRPAMALGVAGFLTEAEENWRAERVLIIGPVPEFRHPVPECLARADHRGLDRDVCSMPRERVEKRRRETMITLDYLAAQFPNVRVIDPIDLFCDERLCRPYDSGGPLYTDGDHLSVRGAEKLYAAFSKDFAWAIEGNAATVSEVSENARGSAAGSAAPPQPR